MTEVNDLDVVAMLTRHRALAYFHAALDISPRNSALEPKYFVFSQTIELALKAFLMVNGHTPEFCQKTLGHDLLKAATLAKDYGLKFSDVQELTLTSLAAQHNRPFSFRYFNPDGWSAPSFENAENCCRHILTTTQGAIFAFARLILLSQKVAFCELGIVDKFGRFVFRHEELRWITQ